LAKFPVFLANPDNAANGVQSGAPSVVPDRVRGADRQSLFGELDFLGRDGLSIDVRVGCVILSPEELGSVIAALVAIDAAGVVVVGAGNIFRRFVFWNGHGFKLSRLAQCRKFISLIKK
jgi:hypothetical protein